MAETRQLTEIGPEIDFLALRGYLGETGNLRDMVSRPMKAGETFSLHLPKLLGRRGVRKVSTPTSTCSSSSPRGA